VKVRGILLLIIQLAVVGCGSTKPLGSMPTTDNISVLVKEDTDHNTIIGGESSFIPRMVIYKTRSNYDNYVPVIMNDSRTRIISYPGHEDIYRKGELYVPIHLERGYLLDRRGINKNVVFTDITYEEYALLKKGINEDELLKHLKDIYPLEEMYITPVSITEDMPISFFNDLVKTKSKDCKIVTVIKR